VRGRRDTNEDGESERKIVEGETSSSCALFILSSCAHLRVSARIQARICARLHIFTHLHRLHYPLYICVTCAPAPSLLSYTSLSSYILLRMSARVCACLRCLYCPIHTRTYGVFIILCLSTYQHRLYRPMYIYAVFIILRTSTPTSSSCAQLRTCAIGAYWRISAYPHHPQHLA